MSGGALATALAVAAGLAGSIQVAVMSRLGERIGVVEALGFATAATAVLALVAVLLARRSAAGYERALHQPWWMLSGGAIGLLIIFTVTYAGPRIGTTATVGILIAGQLVMGVAIDRWGLFGSKQIALHWPRVLGILLLAGGAALSLEDRSSPFYSPIDDGHRRRRRHASGERASRSEGRLDDRADQERERDRADAERAAERDPRGERPELDRRAHDADAEARAPRADEHQRVARAGAEIGADVEGGRGPDQPDPDDEERDAHRQPVVGERVERMDRRQALDDRADEHRVRDGAGAGPAAERPRDEEDDHGDRDVRDPERERRVLRDPLVEHVPRREAELRVEDEHDPEREQEEPGDEARAACCPAAAHPGMRDGHTEDATG